MKALRNVRAVRLVDIPTVNKLTLRAAFLSTEEGFVRNASKFEELEELKELKETSVISCRNEFVKISIVVTSLVISSNCCNESKWTVLDLSKLKWLEHLEMGDDCFENVKELKLIGLHTLERVVIGTNSFTKHKNGSGNEPNRQFYLKDCENIKELKMGRYSFSDFTVCEIANVPSLEVIEMGELNEESCNFYYASLELKSADDGMK